MAEPKALPELIEHIDALFAKATPGEWERDLHDTHSEEATFAYVMGPDGKQLFGAENSEFIVIDREDSGDGASFWDETGKRNFDLVCALKNNWERISAALKASPDWSSWQPTPDNINALPEPLRRWVMELETDADPAGTLRECALNRDRIKELTAKIEALAQSGRPSLEPGTDYMVVPRGLVAVDAGGECSACGFRYQAHKGRIISCPVCALTAMTLERDKHRELNEYATRRVLELHEALRQIEGRATSASKTQSRDMNDWKEDIDSIHLTAASALQSTTASRCKARAANTGANDPQECDWPVCGCDPYAERVLSVVRESGYAIVPLHDLEEVCRLYGRPNQAAHDTARTLFDTIIEKAKA